MYVVSGVTGNTGAVAARGLLDAGEAVRVIVRSAEKGADWANQGAEVAVADFGDAAALTAALTGAEGAYLLNPPNFAAEDVLADQAKIADALAAAVTGSGLGHVVFLSSVGAQHEEGTGPVRSLTRTERAFRALGVDRTFIRAAFFMQNWGQVLPAAVEDGILPTMLDPVTRAIPMVSTDDIGRTAADALRNPATGERIIELSGPADYTATDAATAAQAALGKPVQVFPVPRAQWADAFAQGGLPSGVAALFVEIYDGINHGHVAFEGNGAEQRRGTTTLGQAMAGLAG